MPEVFSPTDISSSPPSPVDSSPRRLSWSKLVHKLTDFSTNSSSIESGFNNGSRSDLSDSGKKSCKHVLFLLKVLFFFFFFFFCNVCDSN